MLVGGVLWGILGDKRGRLSVLFGSILMYSLANIANGFVTSVPAYAVLRLLAGIGLAGELGAGVTLVSEMMSKESRGYGTMLVAGIGIFGAVVGALVGDWFDWRIAYYVGGAMGLCPAGAAHRRVRIGRVRGGGALQGAPRQFLRSLHQRAATAEVRERHPHRSAVLVRRRDSRDVRAGVRAGDGHGGRPGGRARGDVRLHRHCARRLPDRRAQPGVANAEEGRARVAAGRGGHRDAVLLRRAHFAGGLLRHVPADGARVRLLGGVRDDGGGAVRHEHPGHGGDDGAEFRARARSCR